MSQAIGRRLPLIFDKATKQIKFSTEDMKSVWEIRLLLAEVPG